MTERARKKRHKEEAKARDTHTHTHTHTYTHTHKKSKTRKNFVVFYSILSLFCQTYRGRKKANRNDKAICESCERKLVVIYLEVKYKISKAFDADWTKLNIFFLKFVRIGTFFSVPETCVGVCFLKVTRAKEGFFFFFRRRELSLLLNKQCWFLSFSFYCRENSLVERTYENEWMRYCNALRSEYTFFSVVGRVGGEGDFKKNLRRSKTNNQKIDIIFFFVKTGFACMQLHTPTQKQSPLKKFRSGNRILSSPWGRLH